MLACVDVDYRPHEAVAACVLFRDWPDPASQGVLLARVKDVLPYEPGRFYLRELPCLQAVLSLVTDPLDAVVIDGHVWLRDGTDPGLGAHLFEALGGAVPVVGVAKGAFRADGAAQPVLHGGSRQPLWVTAAGLAPSLAVSLVASMHGPHRLPTLLKEADRRCREAP